MKKISAILLTMTLSTLSAGIGAQVTVSSFENTLAAPDTSEQTGTDTSINALDTTKLVDKLEAAGWKVRQESNGSLIIMHDGGTAAAASRENRWKEIEQQLRKSGWKTLQDADGSLILIPPEKPIVTAPKAEKSDTEESFQSMQQKLRDAGWQVTNTADGSILLYPPEQTPTNKPRACPGIPQTAGVTLPVNSWQKAHDIAVSWLKGQSGYHASVGRIRKILNIYIVSIVADRTPHTLLQQIAIRNHDGAVIVLN